MIEEESQKIFEALEKISLRTQEFTEKTGVTCKSGCGQCCENHQGIWAKVGEMLPMALSLFENGKANDYLDFIEKSKDTTRCIVYKPALGEKGMGKCGAYQHRPSICRMFGASISKGKDKLYKGVFCHWQREQYKTKINLLEDENVHQSEEYLACSLDMLVRQSIDLDYLLDEHPINESLKIAIEYVLQKVGYLGIDKPFLKPGKTVLFDRL